MMKKLTNLEKVIKELNAPTVYEDDEVFESQFDFTYRIQNNAYGQTCIYVYDKNENYYIDYAYDNHIQMLDLAREFGFKVDKNWDDEIHNRLNAAIKKDLGDDIYFEWNDNVVLVAVK